MAETVGRYVLHESIARGGMATVHAARLTGAEGFHRLVAAKRLHPELTEDPEFVTMLHDEAKIASRIHHPNVVPVLDVVVTETEVMLVQEYVHGVPLSLLMRRARQTLRPIPMSISVAIAVGILSGLHAAHEARDDLGVPLEVVHRDVSPQNVMLSTEGVPRLLDFGIAKARTSTHHTRPGVVKGKLSYMAPEQIRVDRLTRRADVYAAGVVLWELLANRRIAEGLDDGDFLAELFDRGVPRLVEECSAWRRSLGQVEWKRLIALDAIVMKAISLAAGQRYATAQEMAQALTAAHPPATQSEVAAWIAATAGDHLEKMRRSLAEGEQDYRSSVSRMRATVPVPDVRIEIDVDLHELNALSEVTELNDDDIEDDIDVMFDDDDDDDDAAATSTPPVTMSEPAPRRRPRMWPWLAMAAAILACSVTLVRHPRSPVARRAASAPVSSPLSAPLVESSPRLKLEALASLPPASASPSVSAVCAPSASSKPLMSSTAPAKHP